MDYVQGILSIKISSFITLINELIRKDYLIKVHTESSKKLSIGKLQADNEKYVCYQLDSNLTYDKIREVFVDSEYYVTENLYKLPSYEFLEINDYISLRNLRYTRTLIILAIITLAVDVLVEIIPWYARLFDSALTVIKSIF